MQIYHYNADTGLFSESSKARPDPLIESPDPEREADWLIPAYATPIPPPPTEESQQVFWEDGQWILRDLSPPPSPPPPPSLDEYRLNKIAAIRREAWRRIEAIMPTWMVARQVSGGEAIPESVRQAAQAVRTRSNELEAQVAGMNIEALDTFNVTENDLWPNTPPQEGG